MRHLLAATSLLARLALLAQLTPLALLTPLVLLAATAATQGRGPGAAAAVTTVPAATAHAQEQAPFVVSGRLVTWDGQPIAGARVAIEAGDALTTAELLKRDGPLSGADGTFSLECAPRSGEHERPRHLLFAAKGFAARTLWVPDTAPKHPGADGKHKVGDLVLVPGQRLFGRVRDADGKPVAGALVATRDLVADVFDGDRGGPPQCTARTDASGIFDLPCALPQGSVLTVEADGCYTATRQPVAAGAPLEIELHRSGFVDGRVLDGEAGIGGARAVLRYESHADTQSVTADANGAFRAPLRHPGRWRLWLTGGDGAVTRRGTSKLGTGPATDVRLVAEPVEKPEAAKRVLRVRATTKGTGAAVRTFRAVVEWGEQAAQPWVRQQLRAQIRGTKPSPDGTVELTGPEGDGMPGAVYVEADGHAPLLQKDVTWSETEPTLTVELEAESAVRGVVRDEATKQALANATLSVQSLGGDAWAGGGMPHGAEPLRTGADGTFRIGQLAAGEWEIVATVPGRPSPQPTIVTLQAAEAREGVVIDVPPGARFAGKLVGTPIGRGWRVALQGNGQAQAQQWEHARFGMFGGFGGIVAMDDLSWYDPSFGDEGGNSVAVGADGAFAFEGLAPGHYVLMLTLPAPPRSGASLSLPIDSFRLRAGGLERDVDVASDRAWTVRGKLTLPGAATPFENLVVVAAPFGSVVGMAEYGGGNGVRALVGADGAFELPVLDGRYQLSVFDLALGAVVATSKRLDVRGADVRCDVAVPLTKVTLELKPADPAAVALVERVEVRCKLAGAAGSAADFAMPEEYDFGRGVPVPHGATSLVLALPHGDVTLLLRSHTAQLREEHPQGAPPLAKLEVPVPGDGKGIATIEVPPPPEIPDEIEARGGR